MVYQYSPSLPLLGIGFIITLIGITNCYLYLCEDWVCASLASGPGTLFTLIALLIYA